jgi:hypothetical protein
LVSVLLGYNVAALGSWLPMRNVRTPIGRCTLLRSSSRHSDCTATLRRYIYAASILQMILSLTYSIRIGIKVQIHGYCTGYW